jgi:sensor histidine kinase YesM
MLNVRIDKCDGKKLSYSSKTIELGRNQNSTVITFGTICFNRPNPVEYSWMLESDKEWSAWQPEDYAVLSGLSDGQTKIKVRARVRGLPLEYTTEAEMNIVVNLAIYRQPWFFPTVLGLILILVILAVVLLFQTRTRLIQINKQAKMFQLQAILSQMNPHFIFNVMASLQSMIITANIEKANEYLVKMSNLVRGFLEASISTSSAKSKKLKNGELPLIKELEILQTFIEFQQLIYPDKFDYRLVIDHQIDPDKISIPPMLIQPFVENAIRHGLLQKEKDGLLQIKIDMEESNQLSIIISDNGIGIQKAGEIIGKSPLLYTSRGKELTEKRIKLLNEMGYRIIYQTISSDQGTTVTLKISKHEP